MSLEEFKSLSTRQRLYQDIMRLYPAYLAHFPESKMVEIMLGRYNVADVRLMTLEQVADLRDYIARLTLGAA